MKHDMSTSEELRDAGIAQVSANNADWVEQGLAIIQAMPRGTRYIGEDFRARVEEGIGPPKHPNAVGALVKIAISRDVIVPTGTWKQMHKSSSHARMTPEYWVK